jgi:hypothetical protein
MIYLQKFLFVSALMIVSTLQYASAAPHPDYYSNPDSIIAEVNMRGAASVVADLTRDWNVWDSICDKVATGDQAWLKAAVALHPGTDAGSSEMMDLALGEALELNPENVFKIAMPTFELEFICSGPDVDNPRYDSYDLSIRAINLRIKKVSAIKDSKLKKLSKGCVGHLEESKEGIAQFYEVDKKK